MSRKSQFQDSSATTSVSGFWPLLTRRATITGREQRAAQTSTKSHCAPVTGT